MGEERFSNIPLVKEKKQRFDDAILERRDNRNWKSITEGSPRLKILTDKLKLMGLLNSRNGSLRRLFSECFYEPKTIYRIKKGIKGNHKETKHKFERANSILKLFKRLPQDFGYAPKGPQKYFVDLAALAERNEFCWNYPNTPKLINNPFFRGLYFQIGMPVMPWGYFVFSRALGGEIKNMPEKQIEIVLSNIIKHNQEFLKNPDNFFSFLEFSLDLEYVKRVFLEEILYFKNQDITEKSVEILSKLLSSSNKGEKPEKEIDTMLNRLCELIIFEALTAEEKKEYSAEFKQLFNEIISIDDLAIQASNEHNTSEPIDLAIKKDSASWLNWSPKGAIPKQERKSN